MVLYYAVCLAARSHRWILIVKTNFSQIWQRKQVSETLSSLRFHRNQLPGRSKTYKLAVPLWKRETELGAHPFQAAAINWSIEALTQLQTSHNTRWCLPNGEGHERNPNVFRGKTDPEKEKEAWEYRSVREHQGHCSRRSPEPRGKLTMLSLVLGVEGTSLKTTTLFRFP